MESSHDVFLKIGEAATRIDQKVSVIGVILEFGFPRKTKGTDWFCSMKIIDDSHNKSGITVNLFAERMEKLPLGASPGDIIQLSYVMMKSHNGEVNAVYNKKFSSFALFKGMHVDDFTAYQSSSRLHLKNIQSNSIIRLRNWLIDFKLDEGSNSFLFLREIREREDANLVCKVLHVCNVSNNGWVVLLWDGTDCPPAGIRSTLEDEMNQALHLQWDPLPRDLLRSFPSVGSILWVFIQMGMEEHVTRSFNVGKWMKLLNISCEVHEGMWRGWLTTSTRLRYVPHNDRLMLGCQRSYDERLSLALGCIPYWCFPWCSPPTEVEYDHVPFVTLRQVLTHTEVTAKFKCVVRVVAVFPSRAEEFCFRGTYRLRLTLEDPTARIHAFLYGEDGVKFFDGHPSADVLTQKRNKLLGVALSREFGGAPRQPPWVQCCLKSYYSNKQDPWGSRNYRIFATKLLSAS